MEIPECNIADIGLLCQNEPSTEAFTAFGQNLREALSSVGFVFIRDHGIDQDLIEEAMKASKEFFHLPKKVKEAIPRDPKVQQGYVAPGREIFDQNEEGSKVELALPYKFQTT